MIFFTTEQVLKIHSSLVQKTGGIDGLRDRNLLDSALKSLFQTFDANPLYPTLRDKAAELCYVLVQNHPFVDGNKRLGVHLSLLFLALNGEKLSYSQKELSDFGLAVAKGDFSRDKIKGQFLRWKNQGN